MDCKEFDLVIYGASGFTGAYIVETLVKSDMYDQLKWTVAGRNETKLRKVLADVSQLTDKNIRDKCILIANSDDQQSLIEMAKKTKVIINAVGPYRLYGEAVVKAAVENGASHVDISGEPSWLESMQLKYNQVARDNGVYVVGGCGWDSIPCDMGVHFTKRNFQGDLNQIETFVQTVPGPAGYAINAGTYQTLILGLCGAATDGLGKIRRAIMPQKMTKSSYRPQKRGTLFKHEGLEAWCLPFMGSDKSVVNRSLYFDFVEYNQRPFHLETYLRVSSRFLAVLLALWLTVFSFLVQYSPTRTFLKAYPDLCSFNMFKQAGPSRKQVNQASFIYWFFGLGWKEKLDHLNEQHSTRPTEKIVVRCDGPDMGYKSTSGCILASAITILQDGEYLPHGGGVYSPAAAFGHDTKIYDRLAEFQIIFQVIDGKEQ